MKKITFLLAAILLAFPVFSLSFGKNKVVYKELSWQVIETNNFYVYFTEGSEFSAREASLLAENAYRKLSEKYKVVPEDKIRLFIYRNRIDFEQTNITGDLITEGIAGFTESLKDRIAIPVFTDREYFAHVIEHELVHRFQFEVLYGGFGKSYKLARSILLSQWFMEGMADHEPFDEDMSMTDMLLRDAVIHDMTHTLDQLGGFSYEDGRSAVPMYKESKTIFDYISQKYGEDKIGAILREFYWVSMTSETAIWNVLGISQEELSSKWQYWLKEKYWSQAFGKKKAIDLAVPATFDTKAMKVYNTKPVFSADGDRLYYISDRNNHSSIRCFNMRDRSDVELVGYEYDSINGAGSGLSASPDGKYLAFSGKISGRQMIRVFSLAENRVIYSVDGGLDAVFSPHFSGSSLVFAGEEKGVSDIYLSNIDGSGFKRLTEDIYDDSDPVMADGGDTLFYVSKRGGKRALVKLSGLLSGKSLETVLTPAVFNCVNPGLAADGTLIFSGDPNGIYNLYSLDLAKGAYAQVTDVAGGCFSPDISKDGKRIAFSCYEQGCYNLYVMKFPDKEKLPVFDMSYSMKEPTRFEEKEVKLANLKPRPYEPEPGFDLLFFLLGYDTISGFIGGGMAQFSDMLGEHTISVYGGAITGLQSGASVRYDNRTGRIGFAVDLSSWRNYYGEEDASGNISRYWIEDTSLTLPFSLPVNRFCRFEFSLSGGVETRSYYEGVAGEEYSRPVISAGIAWVEDRISYNVTEPCDGGAWAIQLVHGDYVLGGRKKFTELGFERRDYLSMNRETILASRFFAGFSGDVDRGDFGLGGYNTLRGYPGNDMLGNNMLLWNLEARVTLIDNINYAFSPANWMLLKKISIGIFADTGMVWNGFESIPPGSLKNSVGAGIRFHVFPLMTMPVVLRFDVGRRTDMEANEIFYIGLGHLF